MVNPAESNIGVFDNKHATKLNGLPKTMSRYWVVLVLPIALGLGLRWHHLPTRSLWFDEAFTWKLVTSYSWNDLYPPIAADVHPPLFYLIEKAWVSAFGDGLVALRLPSYVFSAATLALFGWLSAKALSSLEVRVRLAATFLSTSALCCLEAHVRWSQEARMYSLACLLIVATTLIIAIAIERQRISKSHGIAFIALSTMLLYTHYFGLFYFVAQVFFLLWASYRRQPDDHRQYFLVAAMIILPGLFFLPWCPTLLRQMSMVRQDYWIPNTPWITIGTTMPALILSEEYSSSVSLWPKLGITLFLLACAIHACRSGGRVIQLVTAVAILPLVFSLAASMVFAPVIWPRYLIGSAVLITIPVAFSIYRALDNHSAHLISSLLVISLGVATLRQSSELRWRGGAKQIAAKIVASDEPLSPVIVASSQLFFEVDYHMHQLNSEANAKLLEQEKVRNYTGGPILRDSDFVSRVSLIEKHPQFWLVETNAWQNGFMSPKSIAPNLESVTSFEINAPQWEWGQIRASLVRQQK